MSKEDISGSVDLVFDGSKLSNKKDYQMIICIATHHSGDEVLDIVLGVKNENQKQIKYIEEMKIKDLIGHCVFLEKMGE